MPGNFGPLWGEMWGAPHPTFAFGNSRNRGCRGPKLEA